MSTLLYRMESSLLVGMASAVGGTSAGGGTNTTTLVSATSESGVSGAESAFSMRMPVYRSYTSGGVPGSFSACPASNDYDSVNHVSLRTSIWSCKPDLAQQASGALDTAWTTFLNTIPDGHPIYITIQHEPDAKVRKGTFALADWQAMWDEWTAFMVGYKAAHPAKRIKTYLCLTSGPWTYAKTTQPDSYYRGTFDVWAPDCYMSNTTSYENTVGNGVAKAVEYGLDKGSTEWGLPEWGVYYDGNNPDYQASSITAGGTYIDATPGCLWACYFTENINTFDVRPYANSTTSLKTLMGAHGAVTL